MKLVLAEKPSVAQSLAKVLGANKRCDGYLEGNGYIVSWCVGHLVELSPPEAYDETYAKWRLSDLPILPATWKYQVSASTRKQFGILKKLMKRDDVESLVCATDAGKAKKSPDKTPAEIGFSYATSYLNWKRSMHSWMPGPGKPNVLRRSLPYGRLTGHGLKRWAQPAGAVWPKQ